MNPRLPWTTQQKPVPPKDFKSGLERQFDSKETILLFLTTWVWFGPEWWLKPSRIPVPGKLMASSDPLQASGMHLGHRCTWKQNTHTHEIKINIFKWIKIKQWYFRVIFYRMEERDSISPTSFESSPMSLDWDEEPHAFFSPSPKTQIPYIKS